MIQTTRSSGATHIADAAEKALEATAQAIDSSRQLASETAGRIGETARDLRHGAAGLARSGAESVSEAAGAAQRGLGKFGRAARRRVEDNPMKSALIAAAIGAALAALVLVLSHNRQEAD